MAVKVVVHLDMDAFYAAVEVREDPRLGGLPLIIGHRGRRGVVSTCSYEARRFGVRSAMPSLTAERLCPQAVWLPGRMDLYVAVSRSIRRILDGASPVVEPLSIDEAFLDLSGIARDLDEGGRIAADLKARIRAAERLTASAGVAPNKFLAKLASDLEKPDGLVVFPLADVPRRLHPLPVGKLWGVGPKTAAALAEVGVRTVGDVLRVEPRTLERRLGPALAAHVTALARGEDEREVVSEHEARSISEERTYGIDLRDPEEIDRALLARSDGVARELRRQGLEARTVHLKVRTGDYTTWTRALTLAAPADGTVAIVAAARTLLAERVPLGGRGVRLLGVGVSGLVPSGSGQGRLFADPAAERARRLERAADRVRERFGDDAIGRARLIAKKGGHTPPESSSLPSVG